ncbi:MAG TPA: Uma2 family endonuclease [Thermomicrobiales bacterium]
MVAVPEQLVMLPDREQHLRLSYAEFAARVDESAHAEWADGEAIIFMSPKERHQALANLLSTLITLFAEWLRLGIVRSAPYEMRLASDGPVREPDILFIARDHLDRVTADGLTGPADLVIEIVSEESLRRDRADKFYEYQEVGINEYWLFDPRPRRQRADFYRLNERGQYEPVPLDQEGRYHSAILPGFWLKPEWLRQEQLPTALALIALIAPQIFGSANENIEPTSR